MLKNKLSRTRFTCNTLHVINVLIKPRRDQNGNYGRKMSQYSVPSTRPSRGKENLPLPERSVIIRDDPSSQSESSDLNQSECYTDYG